MCTTTQSALPETFTTVEAEAILLAHNVDTNISPEIIQDYFVQVEVRDGTPLWIKTGRCLQLEVVPKQTNTEGQNTPFQLAKIPATPRSPFDNHYFVQQ